MVKTRSLYLTCDWIGTGSWRTDRETDRITVANTRYSLAKQALARKKYKQCRNFQFSDKHCKYPTEEIMGARVNSLFVYDAV